METTQSVSPTNSLWSASVVKQSWAERCTRPHSMETQVDEYSGERSGNGCCLGRGHRSLLAYIQPPIHHKLQVLSRLHGQPAPSLCCCLGWVQPQCTTGGASWGFCLPSPQVSQGSSVLKLYHLVASATTGIINLLKTHFLSFFRSLMKILNNMGSVSIPEGPLRDSATKQMLNHQLLSFEPGSPASFQST